ncbi:miraculin [Trifolium repens]|nr:miraculin [Trifolium repens]
MKIAFLAFVLLFAFLSSKPFLGAADASNEQVVDTLGKKLRADANYYIIPVIPVFRGGTSIGLTNNGQSYPLDVAVVNRYQGLPLTFKPVNPKKGVIRVSTDLNIKFSSRRTIPDRSTVWKLDRFDFSKRQWFVTTGGVVGNPSWETINNWFKIEKYGDAYKLVYCPSVVQSFKHLCKDVGVFVDEKGNKRLALSDVPLKVKFQQA